MPPGPRKGPIYTFFSLKSPGRRTPSRFPNKAPMERDTRIEGILHISQKPHLLGSPVKEPSPRSPSWNPSQRDAPPLQPSFIHLPKSPVYEPSPHRERCLHPATFITYLPGSPVKELPPRPPPPSLFRERRPLHPSVKVPGRRALLQVP